MVPDESDKLNEEIKIALGKLKETKEKRWSIIKQKFFEKYEKCSEGEEEDGFEKYLAVEKDQPAEILNKLNLNKGDKGAWVEQEFIAPELKPFHEEAERLRYNIEDKIKALNLIESLPMETDKQDSDTQEFSAVESSSVMKSSKKQVKKKTKKAPARSKKCDDGSGVDPTYKGLESEPLKNGISTVNKRMVQDVDLEKAINALHENKMKSWSIIKQKFFEKYEKKSKNHQEKGSHRTYEYLGLDADLVYVSDDLKPYLEEGNRLRNIVEQKILSLKPYQAKLKSKKKAEKEKMKKMEEETMKKMVKTTLQFQKKCPLNFDPEVPDVDLHSSTSSKDESVVTEKVPSASKSPRSNYASNKASSSPSGSFSETATNLESRPSIVKEVHKRQSQASFSPSPTSSDHEERTLNDSLLDHTSLESFKDCSSPSKQPKYLDSGNKSLSLRRKKKHFNSSHNFHLQNSEEDSLDQDNSLSHCNSEAFSAIDSTSVKDDFEVCSSAPKKQKYKPNKDQTSSKSEEIPHDILNFTTLRSLFKDSSSPSKQPKCLDSGNKNLSLKRKKKHFNSSHNSYLQNSEEDSLDQDNSISETLSGMNFLSVKDDSEVRSSALKKQKYKPNKDQTSESKKIPLDSLLDHTTLGSLLKGSSSPLKQTKCLDSGNKNLFLKRKKKHFNSSQNSYLQNSEEDSLDQDNSISETLSGMNSLSVKDDFKIYSSALKKQKYKPNKDQTSESKKIPYDSLLDHITLGSSFIDCSSSSKKPKKCLDPVNKSLSVKRKRGNVREHNLSLPHSKQDSLTEDAGNSHRLSASCSSSPFRKTSTSKPKDLSNVPLDILAIPFTKNKINYLS